MSKAKVYEKYKHFQDNREGFKDDKLPGRPITSTTDNNVEKVKITIVENRGIYASEVIDDAIFLGVLILKSVVAKFIRQLLNFKQKLCRVEIALNFINEVTPI